MNPTRTLTERMASYPIASVIVPTHDRPGPLARCLAALERQDYPEERLEIIVVDDGSVPPIEPPARIASIADRWLRQPNAGPAAARNAALAIATGDVVAFTDDDCEPDPGWLARLVETLDREPDALVGGSTVNAVEGNPYSALSQSIVEGARTWMEAHRSDLRFHSANNLAARTDRLRALGGFDPAFRTAEDRELADRWLRAGRPIVTVRDAIVRHHHAMGLIGYWKQHFGYGRGARRLHRARRARGSGRFRPSLSYCLRALARPPGIGTPTGRVARTLLVAVWQVANAAGYIAQSLVDASTAWCDRPSRRTIGAPRRS